MDPPAADSASASMPVVLRITSQQYTSTLLLFLCCSVPCAERVSVLYRVIVVNARTYYEYYVNRLPTTAPRTRTWYMLTVCISSTYPWYSNRLIPGVLIPHICVNS